MNDDKKLLLYEKAALLNPSEETYLACGIVALEEGDNKLAEHYLTRVKTLQGYSELANAYYRLEKYDLAISNYLKALKIREDADLYGGLGKSYLKVGNLDSARKALESSYDLNNDEEIAYLLLIAGGDSKREVISTNVSRETNTANGVILRHNALVELGYPQAAKATLNTAIDDGKLGRNSLFTLAIEQINKQDYLSGYGYLQRARVIDPYYPQIYQQLIIVCEKLGKVDEAREYRNRFASLTF